MSTASDDLPAKPLALTVQFDCIPQSLKDAPHWVLWKYKQKATGKWTKPPYQTNGKYAQVDDESTHAKFEAITAAYETGDYDGVGIVLRDGICGVDLDHVLSDDVLEPWAEKITDQFLGT